MAPHHPTPPYLSTAPRTPRQRPSGLNRPRGVRVACTQGRHAALGFPYLRLFWPGGQNRLRPVLGNRWIGSRASPALAGLDVSDLERLKRAGGSRRTLARKLARSLASSLAHFLILLKSKRGSATPNYNIRRIRRRRRRIRRRDGSGSSVAGSVPSEEPGYPTLPGSELLWPVGPKERAFGPERAGFWPKEQYPGSRVFPVFPVFLVFPVFPVFQSNVETE